MRARRFSVRSSVTGDHGSWWLSDRPVESKAHLWFDGGLTLCYHKPRQGVPTVLAVPGAPYKPPGAFRTLRLVYADLRRSQKQNHLKPLQIGAVGSASFTLGLARGRQGVESSTRRAVSTSGLAGKLSRPPRPSLTNERCQTLNVANASYFGAPQGRVGCSGC